MSTRIASIVLQRIDFDRDHINAVENNFIQFKDLAYTDAGILFGKI